MKKLLLLALFLVFAPLSADAASLYVSPATQTLSVGQTGTFTVYVESSSQAMNAVSGVILADTTGLTLSGASKTGSIISFWAAEPTANAGNGQLSFEGVVLTPGYTGPAGKVLSFTVRAKTAGTYSASFISGSVLANDGSGTDITSSTRGATIQVTASAPVPPTTPTVTPTAPTPTATRSGSAFPITSSTHPDQEKWYQTTTGTFTWDVPQGASATRLLFGRDEGATPTIVYDTPLGSKTISDMPDGVSYLLVQHKVNGSWAGVGSYRVQIDTTPPFAFRVEFPHGEKGINPQPIVLFNTTDNDSGISYYEVQVGSEGPLRAAADADSNPYTLPLQEPGSHVVVVTAHDEAGNTTTGSASFYVEGIEAPEITYFEDTVAFGDLVKVRGTTYQNSTVEIYVRKDGEMLFTEPTKSNSLGDFATILTKRLEPGLYHMTARAIDARGARSAESEPASFTVHGGFITDIGFFIRDHAAISAIVILIIIGTILIHFHGWRQLMRILNRMHAERFESMDTVHRAFELLRNDITSHARKIRSASIKRALTQEELSFLEQFEEELEEAEEVVQKEVKRASRKRS